MEKPHEFKLSRSQDERGLLTFINLPFPINRMYTISKNTNGLTRGHHAHKKLQQLIFCLQGSFTLTVKTPQDSYSFEMTHEGNAVLIPAGYWRMLDQFKSETICLVLASDLYKEEDYIRDFEDYAKWFESVNK
jgi:dTDP-4-dehydrorhamnose 3,5-epimerase-like enzyme